uniref:C2H2-type domain-containing protein n=1 Tax=Anopheles culicifacies TaxID=139723 RepID=A0A182MWM7_9DIPT
MNSATITTDQVYFSLPSNTTLTPQIKTDPQRTASRQYISKVLLKPAKDLTAAHSNSITPQVHQQQSISGANLSNQSTAASHPPTTNEEQQLPQGLVAQNCASQSAQSKRSATALQELVESVLSTSRPAKIARIFEQSDSSAIGKETKSTETTSTTTPEPRTKRSEMYETTAKNHVMPEFISVGEEMPTGIGDNNAYTQSEEFKMECGDVANLSESEEAIEPRNCFEQIVKMGVDNSFLDEDEQVTLQALTCCIEKTQEKKFKCDACGKSFVTWKSLSLHNEIHNEHSSLFKSSSTSFAIGYLGNRHFTGWVIDYFFICSTGMVATHNSAFCWASYQRHLDNADIPRM